jgi:hypothetical protein
VSDRCPEVSEAKLEQTDAGLVATSAGWFVLNARDARWIDEAARRHGAAPDDPDDPYARFPAPKATSHREGWLPFGSCGVSAPYVLRYALAQSRISRAPAASIRAASASPSATGCSGSPAIRSRTHSSPPARPA